MGGWCDLSISLFVTYLGFQVARMISCVCCSNFQTLQKRQQVSEFLWGITWFSLLPSFGKLFDESFPWVKSWRKHRENIQISGLYVSCFGLATGTAICNMYINLWYHRFPTGIHLQWKGRCLLYFVCIHTKSLDLNCGLVDDHQHAPWFLSGAHFFAGGNLSINTGNLGWFPS